MIRKKAKRRQPKRKPVDWKKLAASKKTLRSKPPDALESFLSTSIGRLLGHLFLALTDPTTADDLAEREKRSTDDDRIIVKQG